MTIPPRPLQQKKCASQGGPQVVTCRLIFFHFHFFIDFSFLYFFSFHFSAFLFLPPPPPASSEDIGEGQTVGTSEKTPNLAGVEAEASEPGSSIKPCSATHSGFPPPDSHRSLGRATSLDHHGSDLSRASPTDLDPPRGRCATPWQSWYSTSGALWSCMTRSSASLRRRSSTT